MKLCKKNEHVSYWNYQNVNRFKYSHCSKDINLFKTGDGLKASKNFNVPFLGKIPIDTQLVEIEDSRSRDIFMIKNDSSDTAN